MFSKISSFYNNCAPIIHTELRNVYVANDNLVEVYKLVKENENNLLLRCIALKESSIVAITINPKDNNELIIAQKNGSVSYIDCESLSLKQTIDFNFKIRSFFRLYTDYFILTDNLEVFRYEESSFDPDTTPYKPFESISIDMLTVGSSKAQFAAGVKGSHVYIYWIQHELLRKYKIENLSAENLSITCISAHPESSMIAMGDTKGRIHFWYNMATSSSNDPESSEEEDENWNKGVSKESSWKLTLPRFVKKVILHWHFKTVSCVSFTPSGSFLLSGGAEGVVVKWDISECTTGKRNRKYYPRLGGPIKSICTSDTYYSVTLEENSLYILSSNFTLLFKLEKFCQIPHTAIGNVSSGKRLEYFYDFPIKQLHLPCIKSSASTVLINGFNGSLQMVDCATKEFKTIVNTSNSNYIPREFPTDPCYSEVLLAVKGSAGASKWLATYEELVDLSKQNSGVTDNQSRITWWCFDEVKLSYVRVNSYCTSHLCSPVEAMCFSKPKGEYFYILTKDLRLLVFVFNIASLKNSKYAPWIMADIVDLSLSIAQSASKLRNNSATSLKEYLENRPVRFQRNSLIYVTSNSETSDSLILLYSVFMISFSIKDILSSMITLPYIYDILGAFKDHSSKSYILDASLFCPESAISHVLGVMVKSPHQDHFQVLNHSTQHCSLRYYKSHNISGKFNSRVTAVSYHPSKYTVAVCFTNGKTQLMHYKLNGAKKFMTYSKCFELPSLPDPMSISQRVISSVIFLPSDEGFTLSLLTHCLIEGKLRRDMFYMTSTAEVEEKTVEHEAARETMKVSDVIEDLKTKSMLTASTDGLLSKLRKVSDADDMDLSMNASVLEIAAAKNSFKRKAKEPIDKLLKEVAKYPPHLAPKPEQMLRQMFK